MHLRSFPPVASCVLAVLALLPAFRSASAYPDVLGQPARYVIITPDVLAPSFAPLVEWKNEKGVPALVRPMSQVLAAHPVAADDAERVRMDIQEAHAAGAEWILIGGDAGVMPVRYAWTLFYGGNFIPTDLYLQCLDGTWNADGDGLWGEGYESALNPGDDADLLPDVWVGRAPVTTPADVDLFVAKTLQYQRTPIGDYEHRALCFAEVLFPQDWTPGFLLNFDGAQIIEEYLPTFDLHSTVAVDRYYENHMDPGYRPGALEETHAAVLAALNAGRNLVMGIGHVPATTQLSLGQSAPLSSADALGLTNGPRLSVWFAPSLWNPFDTAPDPLGESLMRAPLGGAAATVSSSSYDFPTASRFYGGEFLRVAYADSVTAVGETLSRARAPFVPFSTFDGVHRWVQMTLLLMGDPELQLHTGPLRTLDVTHPFLVFVENGYIDVTVMTGGSPLPGAKVTAYGAGEFIASQVTDANGAAHIPLPTLGVEPMQVRLTVTACDARPFLGTFEYTYFPLATELSLATSDATAERVRMVWQSGAASPVTATLERTETGESWLQVGEAAPDGAGRFTFEDRSIEPGRSYGYRLAYRDEEGEGWTATTWIRVPERASFTLLGARPNPSRGMLTIAFSLPRAGAARIEVHDLAGRLLEAREVGGLGPGEHVLPIDGSRQWRPGVYLVRLSEGDRMQVQRVALMR